MSLLGILRRISPTLAKAAVVAHTLFVKKGLWRSQASGQAVRADGEPTPWITYPALDYLSQLDFSQATVLEYGSGSSSLWWARRALQVTSVESEREWTEWLKHRAPANLQVIGPVTGSEYVSRALEAATVFQVIVVDGKQREACAAAAVPHLAKGGLLILDNSDWYPQICAALRERGLHEIDFHGFGPVNDYAWTTSIFIRAECVIPHLGQQWNPALNGNLVYNP